MPYAQHHYPFAADANVEFREADFIAEGLDQTRGWFYTLLVIGTALFGKSPYKNVIVNGIVLAEDGEKMSKRKKNYPPVEEILDEFGADALRLYLINTPVVKGGDIKFSKSAIREVGRRFNMMLKNATKFYFEMVGLYLAGTTGNSKEYQLKSLKVLKSHESQLTAMDQWILQCLDELIKSVHTLMEKYFLSGIVERFYKFIDQLSRWYMNLNKKRFKRCKDSFPLDVLGNCLYYFSLLSAPFAPFITEAIYQQLRPLGCPNSALESIHFHQIPESVWSSDGDLLELFEYVSDIVDATRAIRAKRDNTSVKLPLGRITIVHPSQDVLQRIGLIEQYLREELNIEQILYSTDIDFFVEYDIQVNIQQLKKRIHGIHGKKIGECIKFVKTLSFDQKQIIGSTGNVPEDFCIRFDELKIIKRARTERPDGAEIKVVTTNKITVEYDDSVTNELLEKYCANQFHRMYQQARKDAGLVQTDKIVFEYSCSLELNDLLNKYGAQSNGGTYVPHIPQGINPNYLLCTTQNLEFGEVTMRIKRE